jgi:DNA-binding FrmR family transcriptional regulator
MVGSIHPAQSTGRSAQSPGRDGRGTSCALQQESTSDTPRGYHPPLMSQPTRTAATSRPATPARTPTTTRAATTRSATPGRTRSRHVPDPDPYRRAYSRDKGQLVRRLSRMEGQVRGIARMIEREEYCVDILQQTAALRAAVDALSVLVLEDHVQGCVRTAAAGGKVDEYVDEVIDVVRRTLGRPVRGTRSA